MSGDRIALFTSAPSFSTTSGGVPTDANRPFHDGRIFAPNFAVRFIKLRDPEIHRRYHIYQRRGLAL